MTYGRVKTVTTSRCKIRIAHVPHTNCLGLAPEFPSERVITDVSELDKVVPKVEQ